MKTLHVLFGEWRIGELSRNSYIGYCLLLCFALLILAMGAAQYLGDISPQALTALPRDSQAEFNRQMGVPGVLLLSLLIVSSIVAQLNLNAKRIRNMGLPGWRSLIVLIFITIIPARLGWQTIAMLVQCTVLLALALIPPHFFLRKQQKK